MNCQNLPISCPKKLVIASHNRGKIHEIAAMLQPFFSEIIPIGCFSSVEPVESGATFQDNANIKARHATVVSGCLALADDSGLEIDALEGKPGIHAARYAKDCGGFPQAMEDILVQLQTKKERSARFICALSLAFPSKGDVPPQVIGFTGKVEGTIALKIDPSPHGFGYDPIFIPKGYKETFASLPPEIKNKISHRQQAFEKLEPFLAKAGSQG